MTSWRTGAGSEIFQLLEGRSNSYLVSCNGTNLVVDTGRKNSRRHLVRSFKARGIEEGSDLTLVLTHTHFDHAENALFLKENYKARIIVHEKEAGYLAAGDSPLPAGTIVPTRVMMRLFAKRVQPFFRYAPVDADLPVQKAGTPEGLESAISLLPVPGHSTGSLAVIVDGEIALVGDAMFGILPCSILPPFGNDLDEMKKSWDLLLESGCSLFLPGHGRAIKRERLAAVSASSRKGR